MGHINILEKRAIKGPNFFTRRPVIFLRININDYEDKSTKDIPGFYDRLKNAMPSLHEHRCSEDGPGGFFHRVEVGTWIGHVIEHVALELQTLAEMDTGFGRTRSTKTKGVYTIIFSYLWVPCGIRAGEMAIDFCEAIAENKPYDLASAILELKELREEYMLGPSTGSIVKEAEERGIPFLRLNQQSLVQLGYGKYQKRIEATITSMTPHIAVELACDKSACGQMLKDAGIPVPLGKLVHSVKEALAYYKKESPDYPLVVKPNNLSKGRGATIGVKTRKELASAVKRGLLFSRDIIIEKFIEGNDYRLLVINNNLVAAAHRIPASVKGDGKSTIAKLIEKVNNDPRRGFGHERVLTRIEVESMTLSILKNKNLSLESILPNGEILYLKTTANLSTGGTAEDVTDIVHPENRAVAESASRVIGLDIAGIDIVAKSIETPISENGGGIVEINAAPGFRMHLSPATGEPQNVAKHVIDMLFPPGTGARIPIIAVTGTNGKTTTVRLLAHLFQSTGRSVGCTTTEGIFIGTKQIMKGDMTGPYSARVVLSNPTVDFAVLETARGGILRDGLGFDYCDVGVVTNIGEDHIGLKDVETIEEMAMVKSVVVENVGCNGNSVLNACNKYTVEMAKRAKGQVVFFSISPENRVYRSHVRNGGTGATVENGVLLLQRGTMRIPVVEIYEIPITFHGKAEFNVENSLCAALVAYIRGMGVEEIKRGLLTFTPNYAYIPGRTNLIQVKDYEVILDYCHNVPSYEAMKSFMSHFNDRRRVGVITCPGDRRDEDIQRMAKSASASYDHIIIREEGWLRGRKPGEVANHILCGLKESGFPESEIEIILKEEDAITKALSLAKRNNLLVFLVDETEKVYQQVIAYKKFVESNNH